MVDLSELETIEAQGVTALRAASSVDELRDREQEWLGKRSRLTTLNQTLGSLSADERKTAGQSIQATRVALQSVADEVRSRLESNQRAEQLQADRLDLTEPRPEVLHGHLHVVTQTRNALEDVFVGMGYTVAEGPEVETDWYNFEALNMPLGHPARTGFDTMWVDLGDSEQILLRTHTSPVQIRVMEAQKPPIYSVMPGRAYRRDTPDARHLPQFNQIEGLVVDHGITFGDLAGTIEAFTHAYFGPNIESRLRPASFPFTEPSAEFEVTCIFCEGSGCRVCSQSGWIELGGCGMVDPNVFASVDVDSEEWTGFAFGFGIDRLAMIRHQVDDIRHFIDNDIRFLEQF